MTDIACTLTDDDARERFAEYERLLAAAYTGRERTGAGMRWTLRPGVGEWARDLASREMACCPFLRIEATVAEGRVLWEMSAEPSAQPVVDEFYDLPLRGPRGDG